MYLGKILKMVNLRIHRSSYNNKEVNRNFLFVGSEDKHEFLSYITNKDIDENNNVIKFKQATLYNIKKEKIPKQSRLELMNYVVCFFDFDDFENSKKMCYAYLRKTRYYVEDVLMVACGDYGITEEERERNKRRFNRTRVGKLWRKLYGEYEPSIFDDDMDELASFITSLCK